MAVSRYSWRCRSPSAWYGTRARTPCSTSVASRSVSTASGRTEDPLEVGEPAHAEERLPQDEQAPLLADDGQRAGDRAAGAVPRGFAHSRQHSPWVHLTNLTSRGAEFTPRTQEAGMDIAVATRPVQPDDGRACTACWPRLSPDTVYRRFHSPIRGLPRRDGAPPGDRRPRPARGGGRGRRRRGGRRGPLRPLPRDPSTAEVAVLVEDAWQGVGLGRQLLSELIDLARRRGVRTVTATVQPTTTAWSGSIRRLFPGSTMTVDAAVYEIREPAAGPSAGTPEPPATAGTTALLDRGADMTASAPLSPAAARAHARSARSAPCTGHWPPPPPSSPRTRSRRSPPAADGAPADAAPR